MTRIADARTTNGYEFFREVSGLPPLTEAEKAARKAAGEAIARAIQERHDREVAEMKQRILEMLSPESAAVMEAEWTEFELKDLGDGTHRVAA